MLGTKVIKRGQLFSYQILLVDEDKECTDRLVEVFNEQGADVAVASTGQEALDIIKENPGIQVALMDLKFSDMEGIDLVKQIREAKGESPIAFIAISIFYGIGEQEKALKNGYDHFLPKPFLIDAVINLIQHAIAQQTQPAGV